MFQSFSRIEQGPVGSEHQGNSDSYQPRHNPIISPSRFYQQIQGNILPYTQQISTSSCKETMSKRETKRFSAALLLTISCVFLFVQLQTSTETLEETIRRILCTDSEASPYMSTARTKVSRSTESVDVPISLDAMSPPLINARRSPPSHIVLCEEFLRRRNMPGGVENEDVISLKEDEAVCHDWSAPHASLMQMFASSLIGHVSQKYKVSYRHDCQNTQEQSGSNIDWTTIQQIFPSSGLVLDDGAVHEDEIAELCSSCLGEFATVKDKPNSDPANPNPGWFDPYDTNQCLLYPLSERSPATTDLSADMVTLAEERAEAQKALFGRIIRTIQDRMRLAAIEYKTENDIPNFVQTAMESDIVIVDEETEKIEEEDGAIIFIEETSIPMSNRIYAKNIPSTIKTVNILVSPLCVEENLPTDIPCIDHANELKDWLERMFPDAVIQTDVVTSTAAAYSRMILSKYLICPPGTSSCLIPALSKEDGTYAVVTETPEMPGTYRYFDFVSGNENHIQVSNVGDSDVLRAGVREVIFPDGEGPEEEDEKEDTPEERPSPGVDKDGLDMFTGSGYRDGCVELRGKLGSWEQDFHYNSLAGDNADLLRGSTEEGTSESRFAPDTTVNKKILGPQLAKSGLSSWDETSDTECPMDLLNLQGLCEVMHIMKLTVIQFVGDEYTEEQVLNFWKLLNLDVDDSGLLPEEAGFDYPRYRKEVFCEKEKYRFAIVFTPNERLVHHDDPTPIGIDQPRSIYQGNGDGGGGGAWSWSHPWGPNNFQVRSVGTPAYSNQCSCVPLSSQYAYADTQPQARQFIVAGMSPRMTYEEWCAQVNNFGQGSRYMGNNDIVMMRTAVQPTCNCCGGRRTKEGMMSPEDIQKANDYLIKSVDEYRRNTKQFDPVNYDPSASGLPIMHVLDVSHLTDSHPFSNGEPSGDEKSHDRRLCAAQQGSPVEYWNHMMYNNMQDMAAAELARANQQHMTGTAPPGSPYFVQGPYP